jgi:flagellar L-ring protein FlgH
MSRFAFPLRAPRRAVLACLPAALALAGCQTFGPKVDVIDTQPVRPVVAPVPAVNNGAIFQPTAYRPLFEDHRARLVGDTITVQIV